jgi:hypothetical protein
MTFALQQVVADYEESMADGYDRPLPSPVGSNSLEEGGKVALFAPRPHQALWQSFCRSHRLPFRVLPLRRLPALSLFPGQTPAQEARSSAEGNWFILIPISAITAQAVVRSKPGISASNETASSKGAFCLSISGSAQESEELLD